MTSHHPFDPAYENDGVTQNVLIYGYGNLGRCDDGLGVRCAQELESWVLDNGMEHVTVETTYQLNIEDAERIGDFDIVYFIDASIEDGLDDVTITRVEPNSLPIEFSMHAVTPAFVLKLCNTIFDRYPEVFLVHIRGYEWDFDERITNEAKPNLYKALEQIKDDLSMVLA